MANSFYYGVFLYNNKMCGSIQAAFLCVVLDFLIPRIFYCVKKLYSYKYWWKGVVFMKKYYGNLGTGKLHITKYASKRCEVKKTGKQNRI